MKRIFLFSLFAFYFTAANAQSITPDVLSSGGNYFVGSNFTNSFTVGQGSLTQTFTGSNFILTQGFQQPYDFSTSINELHQDGSVGTYPNPSNGSFDLQYDLDAPSTVTIEVYDIVGRAVYAEKSERESGHQLQTIDIGDQPAGVYFVRLTINANGSVNTISQKITISR